MNKDNNAIFYITAVLFAIVGLSATINENDLLLILSFLTIILIVSCVFLVRICSKLDQINRKLGK